MPAEVRVEFAWSLIVAAATAMSRSAIGAGDPIGSVDRRDGHSGQNADMPPIFPRGIVEVLFVRLVNLLQSLGGRSTNAFVLIVKQFLERWYTPLTARMKNIPRNWTKQ